MSRESMTSLRARVKELEADVVGLTAEVAQWKQDYKDLAFAVAHRDGYPVVPKVPEPVPPLEALTTLPSGIFAAIASTTEPHSEARSAAILAARELLEHGASADDVETQIRLGDEVKV